MTEIKDFDNNNKVQHTADPSLQTKPLLALRLKPIHAASEECDLYNRKHQR